MTWVRERSPEDFRSLVREDEGQRVVVWHGDALHDGPPHGRHRLWMTPGGWKYERVS